MEWKVAGQPSDFREAPVNKTGTIGHSSPRIDEPHDRSADGKPED
jgi:hypothetical protein